ncbi:MAG: glutathione S-transferase family protein [Myxococcales bacterium]|nr:glutathione S-transferase family protein [Myxococcales bacterium]MCB9748592.1 glutathione S-transferase family protein [Myxococcales bacterium]
MNDDDRLILWQTPACWGAPSTSPFSIKLETWLRMAELPYEARSLTRPPRSSTGKIPYIERADGSLLADSGVIIDALTRERGVTLDDGLTPRQRALATAITRTLEDHFYWSLAWDRIAVDAHWRVTRAAYFVGLPWPLPTIAPPVLRRGMLRALHGQGFGRMPEAEIMDRVRRDLDALVELIDGPDGVLGRPSSVDATVYGFLLAARCPPWDGPLQRAVNERPALTGFCDAVARRVWGAPVET